MKGIKTFIFSGLLFVSSAAAMVFDLSTRWTVPGLGMAMAIGLVTLRIGIKDSWSRAYKVYVDRADPTKVKMVKTEGKIPDWKE